MIRRAAVWAIPGLVAASFLAGQAAPAPTPTPRPAAGKAAKPRPPIDFSGIWELDPKASQGVAKAMENAAFRVQQNGNRIWLEPMGVAANNILAEQIVVDGQLYEKSLGKQKGTLIAKWGKDNASLWMEAVSGTEQDPRAAVQRMVWRLQDFGNTWTRQTWSIAGGTSKQTFLVFRRRPANWVPPVVTPLPPPTARPPE
jgi:hypothetical protein